MNPLRLANGGGPALGCCGACGPPLCGGGTTRVFARISGIEGNFDSALGSPEVSEPSGRRCVRLAGAFSRGFGASRARLVIKTFPTKRLFEAGITFVVAATVWSAALACRLASMHAARAKAPTRHLRFILIPVHDECRNHGDGDCHRRGQYKLSGTPEGSFSPLDLEDYYIMLIESTGRGSGE